MIIIVNLIYLMGMEFLQQVKAKHNISTREATIVVAAHKNDNDPMHKFMTESTPIGTNYIKQLHSANNVPV